MVLLILSVSLFAQGQKDSIETGKSNYMEYGEYIIYQGDTLLIQLDEVNLMKKLKFHNSRDRRVYYWYRRKVLKVYPYAKMFKDRLDVILKRLENMPSKRARKIYIRRLEKYFENELTDQLKNLTRREGRILIKLIHRQTGRTAYDWLKDLKSGWKAYWSDKMAKLFQLSLKLEYHPESDKEDFLIEDILRRAFNDMVLEEQKAALDIDYNRLSEQQGKFIEIDYETLK